MKNFFKIARHHNKNSENFLKKLARHRRKISLIIFTLLSCFTCSCCVDEVAAEHMGADCVVHFGPSCLTQ